MSNSNQDQPLKLIDFLRRIPKVDIHYHLMGGVTPETMYQLAQKYETGLSREEVNDYYERDINKSKGAVYALEMLYSLMREPVDLYRIAYEIAESSSSNGVKYQELTWNPDEIEMGYTEATEALLDGFTAAEKQFGIVTRLIPGINRERSPEIAVNMVTEVVANPYPEVIGIGMDYKEHNDPPEKFREAYRIAKDAGLKLTAHCCEWEMPWRNLETALDLLQCDRIDHGYTVLENIALTQRCVDTGVFFTVVPSNSYYWKKFGGDTPEWRAQHPLRAMFKAGLRVIPGTDDPELHLTDATNCYRTLVEDFDFSIDDIRQCIVNGIDGCWAPEKLKRKWRIEWLQEFDELRSEMVA